MLKQVEEVKDQGRDSFKKGDYKQALEYFLRAAQLAKAHIKDSSEIKKSYLTSLTNAATAAQNLKMFARSIQICDQALESQEGNEKALYRRAVANKQIGEELEKVGGEQALQKVFKIYLQSRKDFQKLLKVTDNKQAANKRNELLLNLTRVKTILKSKGALAQQGQTSKVSEKASEKVEQGRGRQPDRSKRLVNQQNVKLASEIVREKVEKQLMSSELPKFRSQFQRNLKTLQKRPQLLFNYFLKLTSQYILQIQPDIDTIFQCATLFVAQSDLLSHRQKVLQILKAFSQTKIFSGFLKMMTLKEKKNLQDKIQQLQGKDGPLTAAYK